MDDYLISFKVFITLILQDADVTSLSFFLLIYHKYFMKYLCGITVFRYSLYTIENQSRYLCGRYESVADRRVYLI